MNYHQITIFKWRCAYPLIVVCHSLFGNCCLLTVACCLQRRERHEERATADEGRSRSQALGERCKLVSEHLAFLCAVLLLYLFVGLNTRRISMNYCVAHGYRSSWLSLMIVTDRCRSGLSLRVVAQGCRSWLSLIVVTHGCHSSLSLIVVTHRCRSS